jgi:hypothetical protein
MPPTWCDADVGRSRSTSRRPTASRLGLLLRIRAARVHSRASPAGSRAAELLIPFVGQVVGRMNSERSARQVIFQMVDELIATWQALSEILEE